MQLSEKIKTLERYSKALGDVLFTVSVKGEQITVKLGRKYNVVKCPDKDSASIVAEALQESAKSIRKKIEEELSLLELNCEQLKLPLFSKEVNDGTNDGFKPRTSGCNSDSDREYPSGEEPA